jgi:hypothetical protein
MSLTERQVFGWLCTMPSEIGLVVAAAVLVPSATPALANAKTG